MPSSRELQSWSLAIDDTDSLQGDCTTETMFSFLASAGETLKLIDFPHLIRFNPNVPWKTRGNGGVSIRFQATRKDAEEIFEELNRRLPSASTELNRNPGIVLIPLDAVKEANVQKFYHKIMTRVVLLDEAIELLNTLAVSYLGKGTKRGLIGALGASIASLNDFTFELLTYRTRDMIGQPRKIETASVLRFEKKWFPRIFNSYDIDNDIPLIAPRGKDPVLFGLRGENPLELLEAYRDLEIYEPVAGGLIFKTNQGTDQHLEFATNKLIPFQAFVDTGIVISPPEDLQGGHVRFLTRSKFEKFEYWTVCYEPSKQLRSIIRKLIPNDEIEVAGGVRNLIIDKRITINLERLKILRLEPGMIRENPHCPQCNKHLTSKGKGQGFKCKKCKKSFPDAKPTLRKYDRGLHPAIYLPPPSAQRHLTQPICRYGIGSKAMEKYNQELFYPISLSKTRENKKE